MALGDNLTLGNEKLMRKTGNGQSGKGAIRKSDGEESGLTTHRDYLLEEEAYTHQQLQRLLEALEAFRNGDTSVRLSKERDDIHAEIAESYNAMVAMIGGVVNDVSKVSRQVGTQGVLGAQATVPGAAGIWKDLTDNVNMLANNLTEQVRNIAEVTTAVANGDLTKSITVEVQGEMADLKKTMNQMVVNLNAFASEVTRVAREVGTEGKLGGQANVPGVAGIWKDLTDNVNFMAGNLTTQVRGIVNVVTAVAKGDLTQRLVVEAKGEIAALADTINNMTDTLGTFADQVTNVARTVGVEGRLGAQAEVPGAAGTWKDLTDNVNLLAGNLTSQVRNIAEVSTAVANGDLTKSITVEAQGEIADLKETINQMVINLNGFASEVTRVAREVGTEGQLGGQANVPGVAGIWKDLTDNVNMLANNLTEQVRNIAEVTTAVANGDLTRSITVEVQGEMADLKKTMNQMVVNLNAFASEVTRVAREVGTEGKLGGQANVPGVAGIWKDLTDNVNFMAGNLTTQVRGIVNVVTAVAKGDLTQRLVVEAKGEIAALADTINNMTDTLGTFADQVTNVARTVGVEGRLGAQAEVPGAAGTWKDLTDNVNLLAGNLTSQVRNIAEVSTAVANGDLTKSITVEALGEIADLKETINQMVINLNAFASEVTRVAREVGTEGKLGGQAEVPGVAGIWKELTDNVNLMAGNLTSQVRSIAEVATAVAFGDLTRSITVDAKGEIAQLKDTINQMVVNLNAFSSEVTRVAREVGTEGKLGGQANVPGVAGIWKDLTDNVNAMASNLTTQVRGIVKVVTAVANGDLTQKLVLEAKGEIAALADTINSMVDDLNRLADEISRVAKVAGEEGKLTERAVVEGVGGSWQQVVDTLNRLIESIAVPVLEVSRIVTAISEGDLTQNVRVQTAGDIKEMSDNLDASLENLNAFISQIKEAADTVAAASQAVAVSGVEMNQTTSQVAKAIQQIAQGASDQAQKTVAASGSVEQISRAAEETAHKGNEVNLAAQAGSQSAKQGVETVGEAVESMNRIAEAAERTSSTLEALILSTERISKALQVITDIASQTNLLALNAAIEAARAGEAGRGFAVVAENVRELAMGSRKSADEISELVSNMQKESATASEAVRTMLKNVASGGDATNKSSDAFREILNTIDQTVAAAVAISQAAEQQKEGITDVVKIVDEISSIAQQTSSGAQQTTGSAQRLTSAMQELTASGQDLAEIASNVQERVAAFKLKSNPDPRVWSRA